MSEDEIPPARFAGRTYTRSKRTPANISVDETSDGKVVPVKAAVSLSKWGKANYVPFREGSESGVEAKRMKVEVKEEDPFSFDTEDKSKSSPAKKTAVLQQQEPRQPTKLPASRLVVKEDELKKQVIDSTKDDDKPSSLRTYTRTSAKTPIIMNQFIEVGKTQVAPSGERKFIPSKDSPLELKDDSESEDDCYPVSFKRDPLKTYSGEVVTPVDKPDSPPIRKSSYKKKGGPRGRKPLTVSDPELIEEYKRNYAAQQLKGKPDTATGGLNNSTVVFKKELANEDQGTTVVVVCKPKKQVEKVDSNIKNSSKIAKAKGGVAGVLEASSQESSGENGNTESPVVTPVSVSVRTRSHQKNNNPVAAISEGSSSQGTSAGRVTPMTPLQAALQKNNTEDLTPSSIENSQGDALSGKGKRYRIFKSRTPHVEESRPPVFEEDQDKESPLGNSNQQHFILDESSQASSTSEQVVYVEIDVGEIDNSVTEMTPESSQTKLTTSDIMEMDGSSLTPNELLAAQLHNIKNDLLDSTQETTATLSSESEIFEESSKVSSHKSKPDSSKNISSGVSKKRVTIEDKNKSKIQGESYKSNTAKTVKGGVTTITDSSSQDLLGENGNTQSSKTIVTSDSTVALRTSARKRNSSQLAASYEGKLSQSSNASSQISPSPKYRIFKSRKPNIEDDLKPPVFGDDIEEIQLSQDSSQLSSTNEQALYEESDVVEMSETIPESSQSTGTSDNCGSLELDVAPSTLKHIDSSSARESLAARLRNMEKNDSDSNGEPDNLSESSENLQSQGSPFNSQSTNDDGSQKSVSSPPRKFFKSKKFSLSSIDHHRKLLTGSPHKGSPAKVTYNARTWNNENDADEEENKKKKGGGDDDVVIIKDSAKGPKLKREIHWPERNIDEAYTSLRVSKTHKELYTVVHHVKESHEVQELGETQDFMDEVEYLLDSLQDTKSKSIRCLSCLKLAGKCISPAFRMHLRAHGTVTKIFSLLHDACSDPCLALSTSAMMFMLSRDTLNMDLDKDSLSLMLKLNDVDTADRVNVSSNGDLEKTKHKVQELLAQLQQETHAREIDLGFVSTANLALESLLSLTSRRAGEWFKEELRSYGGLDRIVDSVRKCERNLPEDLTQDIQNALPVLRKLDRCLRVLENISFMNADNQNYLIGYKNAALLQSCTRILQMCQKCMPSYKVQESVEENKAVKDTPGFTILTCMLAVLRVLLNVTHEHKLGDLDPSHETSLMTTIVKCLTSTQWCIPIEQRFDLAILCLGLLINLVENRETNRKIMMEMETEVKYTEKEQLKTMSAIKAVVELFVQREEAARELEEDNETSQDTSAAESPNKSGEWKESDSGIQWITNSLKKAKEEEEKSKSTPSKNEEGDEANQTILEDDEETFTRALLKAGKHMENSIVASYAGLLLGTTIINNKEYSLTVKQLIPQENFGPMIKMLKKFLNFMSLTTAFGSTDVNNITKVINVLESA